VINEGTGSRTLVIPLLYSVWVRGFLWLEVLLVSGVDGVIEGLQASPQSGFQCLRWSGVVEDVLRIPHRADLP
jgi:hypothetical protein